MSNEALPDATSTFKALRYVETQAARGHFKGHSTALLVMYYLVMNMWMRPSPDGMHGPGDVMAGKSAIGKIAAGTALCRRSVQAALHWLADEEWINMQRARDDSGRELVRDIYVRLDMPGHRERERRRASKPAPLRVIEGGGEGAGDAPPGMQQMHTPRVQQMHTLQR